MKTNIQTLCAVRRTALVLTTMILPALATAQPAKSLTIRSDDVAEVRAPQPLQEVPYLGISTHGIEAALAAQMELPPETGLVVVHIMPDSPAASVLKQHDLLTRFEDQILIEPRQLGVLVRSKKEGETVKLTLFRSGKQQTVSVTLGKKAMPPLPGRFVPGSRKTITFEGEPLAHIRAQKLGPAGSGGLEEREMRISRFEGKNSQMVFDDGDGRLEVNFKGGKKHLVAHDTKGKILFSGPVETAEERKALPAEVRTRLEKMEAMDVRIPAPPPAPVPPGTPGDVLRAVPGAFGPSRIEWEAELPEPVRMHFSAAEADVV